jgi:hypothetical protein
MNKMGRSSSTHESSETHTKENLNRTDLLEDRGTDESKVKVSLCSMN